jgi:hypothetical protein
MFYASNKCDSNLKEWSFFSKMNDYQKKQVWHKQECD